MYELSVATTRVPFSIIHLLQLSSPVKHRDYCIHVCPHSYRVSTRRPGVIAGAEWSTMDTAVFTSVLISLTVYIFLYHVLLYHQTRSSIGNVLHPWKIEGCVYVNFYVDHEENSATLDVIPPVPNFVAIVC